MNQLISVINYGAEHGLLSMTNNLRSQEAWQLKITKLSSLYDSPAKIFDQLKKEGHIVSEFSYLDIASLIARGEE